MKVKNVPELVEIRKRIIEYLQGCEILPFIIDEILDSLYYINKYKLLNIQNNIVYFAKQLEELSKNYTNSLIKA